MRRLPYPSAVCSWSPCFSFLAMAQSMPADAPNARDHAVLSRYAGSWLVAQDVKSFDQASIPSGDADVVKLEDG